MIDIDNHQSICLFHNGNRRVLNEYQKKFSNLKFSGNWAEATEISSSGHLWEISFADATPDNLLSASKNGVFILRHISNYQDDLEHRLPECLEFDYNNWLNYAVSNNLCYSNKVISELKIDEPLTDNIAIITTGRTANSHLQSVILSQGNSAFEYSKTIDSELLRSKSAIFLWRVNQWECLASTWIAIHTEYKKSHQIAGVQPLVFDDIIPKIDHNWIHHTWVNICHLVLDHAMFYRYVCQRPIKNTTTEHIVNQYQSNHEKISYDKSTLIENYSDSMNYYNNSDINNSLNFLYNNVIKHFTIY